MKEKIVNTIQQISGRYPPVTVFSDWVECMAIAIQNSLYMVESRTYILRENRYREIIRKYDMDEIILFLGMFSDLANGLEKNPCDLLGEIYMETESGNKHTGQFFTPFHISELVAGIMNGGKLPAIVNEPSVGSGGMIIALANELKKKGINYQTSMRVTAQDLDYRSVHMAYVQFSLLGIDAVVVQGDTLVNPYKKGYQKERVWRTPRNMGVLL